MESLNRSVRWRLRSARQEMTTRDYIDLVEMVRQVIVFDAADLDAESSFWASVFDGRVIAEADWHSVIDGHGRWRLGVQLNPNHQPPEWPHGVPQQIHLDLHVTDIHAAHDQVMSIGAQLLQASSDLDAEAGFQVYSDPAGHPFCIGWGHPSPERLQEILRGSFEEINEADAVS